jgi:hypothetical protein
MTEPTIPELADQIRAGLQADQEDARWASSGPWWVEGGIPVRWGDERDSEVVGPKGTVAVLSHDGNGALNAANITRHDPRRVLAEVASKRALLDEVLGWGHLVVEDGWYSCSQAGEECWDDVRNGQPCDCGLDERVRAVLQRLADPYREQP